MFQIHTSAWGQWEAWQLSDASGQHRMTVIPAHGGILNALTLYDLPVLQGYETPEEAEALYYYKGAWLFPFANRLEHGTWSWQGKSYQWPINDVTNGHALHGGIAKAPFTVHTANASETKATIQLRFLAAEHWHAGYPFPFELLLTYTLTRGALQIEVQVHNPGTDTLPYQLGWHPYFKVPGNLDDWRLQLPSSSAAILHPDFMPTGQWEPFELSSAQPLGQHHLDHCLRKDVAAPVTCVQVAGQEATLLYEQQGFDYYMLFTPSEWRSAIAIEPMTGPINSLNSGIGRLELPPGARNNHQCVLTLKTHPI